MLKDVLIKCFTLAGREDIVSKLGACSEIFDLTDTGTINEINSLINHYNFVTHSTFEHYLELEKRELIQSNEKAEIVYSSLSETPVLIKNVENENSRTVRAMIKTNCIIVPKPNCFYYVVYNAIPKEAKSLSDDTSYLSRLTEKIVILGTVSQYLACKGKLIESEYFEKKFFEEAFKIKSKKERRIKSTFCL